MCDPARGYRPRPLAHNEFFILISGPPKNFQRTFLNSDFHHKFHSATNVVNPRTFFVPSPHGTKPSDVYTSKSSKVFLYTRTLFHSRHNDKDNLYSFIVIFLIIINCSYSFQLGLSLILLSRFVCLVALTLLCFRVSFILSQSVISPVYDIFPLDSLTIF